MHERYMYRLVDRVVAVILLLVSLGIAYRAAQPVFSPEAPGGEGRAYSLLGAIITHARPDRLMLIVRKGEPGEILSLLPETILGQIGRLAINRAVVLEREGDWREYASYTLMLGGLSVTIEVWV